MSAQLWVEQEEPSTCQVMMEDQLICTIALDSAGAPRVCVHGTAALVLDLPGLEIRVGNSLLRLSEDGVQLITPGTLQLEGRRRVEVWGGPQLERE